MPRRRITFRQLETFAAVAKLNSFTKAADALHLTQPAVSIQIKQISETIGQPLFEQTGRDIALTPAGEELLKTVRSLDDIWNHFESAIDELKGLKRGKLRVALVTTAKYFLPRMLGAFCKRYPEIDIELEIANREKIVERLRNNQDDLYEYVVIAPTSHWAVGKPVTLQELAKEPFLLREQGSGSRHVIDEHMRDSKITLKVRLALASNEAIRDLVASGMGLSVLSRHALGNAPERDGLAVLNVDGFPLKQAWNVVHLSSKILSLPAKAFLDELLNEGLHSPR